MSSKKPPCESVMMLESPLMAQSSLWSDEESTLHDVFSNLETESTQPLKITGSQLETQLRVLAKTSPRVYESIMKSQQSVLDNKLSDIIEKCNKTQRNFTLDTNRRIEEAPAEKETLESQIPKYQPEHVTVVDYPTMGQVEVFAKLERPAHAPKTNQPDSVEVEEHPAVNANPSDGSRLSKPSINSTASSKSKTPSILNRLKAGIKQSNIKKTNSICEIEIKKEEQSEQLVEKVDTKEENDSRKSVELANDSSLTSTESEKLQLAQDLAKLMEEISKQEEQMVTPKQVSRPLTAVLSTESEMKSMESMPELVLPPYLARMQKTDTKPIPESVSLLFVAPESSVPVTVTEAAPNEIERNVDVSISEHDVANTFDKVNGDGLPMPEGLTKNLLSADIDDEDDEKSNTLQADVVTHTIIGTDCQNNSEDQEKTETDPNGGVEEIDAPPHSAEVDEEVFDSSSIAVNAKVESEEERKRRELALVVETESWSGALSAESEILVMSPVAVTETPNTMTIESPLERGEEVVADFSTLPEKIQRKEATEGLQEAIETENSEKKSCCEIPLFLNMIGKTQEEDEKIEQVVPEVPMLSMPIEKVDPESGCMNTSTGEEVQLNDVDQKSNKESELETEYKRKPLEIKEKKSIWEMPLFTCFFGKQLREQDMTDKNVSEAPFVDKDLEEKARGASGVNASDKHEKQIDVPDLTTTDKKGIVDVKIMNVEKECSVDIDVVDEAVEVPNDEIVEIPDKESSMSNAIEDITLISSREGIASTSEMEASSATQIVEKISESSKPLTPKAKRFRNTFFNRSKPPRESKPKITKAKFISHTINSNLMDRSESPDRISDSSYSMPLKAIEKTEEHYFVDTTANEASSVRGKEYRSEMRKGLVGRMLSPKARQHPKHEHSAVSSQVSNVTSSEKKSWHGKNLYQKLIYRRNTETNRMRWLLSPRYRSSKSQLDPKASGYGSHAFGDDDDDDDDIVETRATNTAGSVCKTWLANFSGLMHPPVMDSCVADTFCGNFEVNDRTSAPLNDAKTSENSSMVFQPTDTMKKNNQAGNDITSWAASVAALWVSPKVDENVEQLIEIETLIEDDSTPRANDCVKEAETVKLVVSQDPSSVTDDLTSQQEIEERNQETSSLDSIQRNKEYCDESALEIVREDLETMPIAENGGKFKKTGNGRKFKKAFRNRLANKFHKSSLPIATHSYQEKEEDNSKRDSGTERREVASAMIDKVVVARVPISSNSKRGKFFSGINAWKATFRNGRGRGSLASISETPDDDHYLTVDAVSDETLHTETEQVEAENLGAPQLSLVCESVEVNSQSMSTESESVETRIQSSCNSVKTEDSHEKPKPSVDDESAATKNDQKRILVKPENDQERILVKPESIADMSFGMDNTFDDDLSNAFLPNLGYGNQKWLW